MVLKEKIFEYIEDDVIFENEPLKLLAANKDIFAFKHAGFFRPMDTYREFLELNTMWEENLAPWKI